MQTRRAFDLLSTRCLLVATDEAISSTLPWILRVGLAGCYIGHGAFGLITKAAWLPYFAVTGVGEPSAWQLMPWIGAMDLAIGMLVLAWPCRALFLWATVWTLWTALLRPLAGESCWEFWERAGNYGVPFAVIATVGWRGTLLARLPARWPALADAAVRARLGWILRLVTVALLAGHGGCTLLEAHASFTRNYAAIWPAGPAGVVPLVGILDLALAAGVLFRPTVAMLIGVCGWKFATESLFPLAGAPVWELIERFGSYAAPLALAVILARDRPTACPTKTAPAV
jgi:hypothetical protein